jgi:carbonic anhydrase/acetyltransferase-like protein (isoleucine patch superfamily)
LGRDCSVWCNTVLRGDVNRIVIGDCSNVQDFAMGHVSHKNAAKPDGSPLIIGNYVTIGHSALLHGCTIGDECLIGMGSIIMDDVVVQNHVMVGAGSLVSPGKVLEERLPVCRPPGDPGEGAQRRGDRLPEVFGRALRARQEQLSGRDNNALGELPM